MLRGEKARFQLFGDTMNTASRMESTSIKNMIQISADTAALLKKSNKGSILVEREGLIKAKGKGYMQTFWLRPKTLSSTSTTSSSFSESNIEFQHEADQIHSRALHDVARAELGLPSFSHQAILTKSPSYTRFPSNSSVSWRDTGLVAERPGHHEGLSRLIKWNTKVLESILTKIVMQKRITSHTKSNKYNESTRFHEEVAQAVSMPHFNRKDMSAACLMPSQEKVNLIPNKAREELRAYVASIASMYNQVHFHSFEHASHVTMSAQKLINKVILRNSQEIRAETEVVKKSEEVDLFFSTYGISADPLAQFAVVFAALVHDVEHTGVPNVQLITENTILAEKYKNKSVAENNSIQIAWSELLKPEYTNLRKCIFATDDDELRFRQLLINVVIATDIADRERRAGEGIRWKTAFCNVSNWGEEWDGKSDEELSKVDVSLKATVVLEQIVLASDVAHTMQHWLTYVKWNERLYKEMWAAYSSGRAEKDPTEVRFCSYHSIIHVHHFVFAHIIYVHFIHSRTGIEERLASLNITSYRWQQNSRSVVSLVLPVMNIWVMLYGTRPSGLKRVRRLLKSSRRRLRWDEEEVMWVATPKAPLLHKRGVIKLGIERSSLQCKIRNRNIIYKLKTVYHPSLSCMVCSTHTNLYVYILL